MEVKNRDRNPQVSNLNGGVFAFENVGGLLHVDLVKDDFVVALLILDDPLFVALALDKRGFGGDRGRPRLLRRLFHFSLLHHAAGSQVRVLVRHLVFGDLLQPAGDVPAFVDVGEEAVSVATGRLGLRFRRDFQILQILNGGRRWGRRSAPTRRGWNAAAAAAALEGRRVLTVAVPRDAGRVIFFDVAFEFFEKGDPSFGPLAVLRVLFLELAQDAVGVELGGVGHFLDVGRRRRFDGHPAQSSDRLADRREMVEDLFVGAVPFAHFPDFWSGEKIKLG